jgi:Tol biopolymer transport system component
MSTPAIGRIAFVHKSADEASGGVVLVNADGTRRRPLTRMVSNVLDGQPDWSPDGKRVVFTETKNDNTDHASIRLISAPTNGKSLTPLTPGRPARGKVIPGYDDRGSYSPDGGHIAYIHADGRDQDQLEHSNVYIMDANGKHARRISKFPPFSGDVEGVAWSPDGQQLVFSYLPSPMSERTDQRALFLVNVDGTHQRQLTPASLGAGGVPDWSADRNLIVFRAVEDEESGIGNFFTIHPDGSSVAQVTHFDDKTVISHKVGFSPDGTSITFAKGPSSPESDVFTIAVDGSNLRQVTDAPGPDTSPDWTPTT